MAFTCSFSRNVRYTKESVSYGNHSFRLGDVTFTNTESAEVRVTSFIIGLAVLADGVRCDAGNVVVGTGTPVTLGITHGDYSSYIDLSDATISSTTSKTSQSGGGYPTESFPFTVKFSTPLTIPAGATWTYHLGKRYNSSSESNTLVTTSSGTLSCEWSSKIPGKPPAPSAESISLSSTIYYEGTYSFSTTASKAQYRYRDVDGNWSKWADGGTSYSGNAWSHSAVQWRVCNVNDSYEIPQSDWTESPIVQYILNTPTISIDPSTRITANTTTPDEFLSDVVVLYGGTSASDKVVMRLSATNGTNPSGCAQYFEYFVGDDQGSGWFTTSDWEGGMRPLVSAYDDYGRTKKGVVKWRAYLKRSNFSDSAKSSEVSSPEVRYVPQDMNSDFSLKFFNNSAEITSSTVVVPKDSVGVGWSSFPLSLAKGNFSYYKIDLVPQDGGASRTTGYKRNNQSLSQVDSSRDTIYIDPNSFNDLAGKKYKLKLITSYYYKRPNGYYNPSISEGYNDGPTFESAVFLVGGLPDTPAMLYPSTLTAQTFNNSPQIIFKVTDSYTTIKDIRVVVGSVTYRYSTNKDLFESKSWTSGKPGTITSGTVVAFKLPSSTATSRDVKIYATNSYDLECLSPASFAFEYHEVTYRTSGQRVSKAVTEDYFKSVLDSYSLVYKVSASLYQNSEIVLNQGFVDALTAMKTLRSEIIKLIPDQSEDTVSKINSYLESAKVSKDETLKGQSTTIVKGNNFNYVLDVLKTML